MSLNRKIYLFTTILFFVSSISKGAEYYFFSTKPINYYRINGFEFLPKDLNLEFLDSLNKFYNNNERSYTIIKSQNTYKLHVRCTLDFFQLSENRIENLYKFDNSGYLCKSHFFERDGKNYALGGYGFWTHHQDLLVLDEELGSWEFVSTTNQPLNFTGSVISIHSGFLILFGSYKNTRTNLNKIENHGWFLDWETKKWDKIDIKLDGIDVSDFRNLDISGKINLKDYYVFGTDDVDMDKRGLFFIDKVSLEIFYLQKGNLDLFKSPYIQVIDNAIYFQSLDGTHQIQDIPSLQKNSKKVGQIEILKDSKSFLGNRKFLLLILIGFFIITLFSYFYWIRKKGKPEKEIAIEVNNPDGIIGVIQKLTPSSGQTLDIDALDLLFGIHDIPNFDNRRVRRSRIIMDINTNYRYMKGKDLIKRVKKSDDKRFTYYNIEL